jgi:hypothetical protein
MPYCIYTDYSHEELESAGISTVDRGTTYFENLAAHNSEEHLNISSTLFTAFLPESDDEEDEKDGWEDESDRMWNLDKNDVSDVI